jgi:hypothetical protein
MFIFLLYLEKAHLSDFPKSDQTPGTTTLNRALSREYAFERLPARLSPSIRF